MMIIMTFIANDDHHDLDDDDDDDDLDHDDHQDAHLVWEEEAAGGIPVVRLPVRISTPSASSSASSALSSVSSV